MVAMIMSLEGKSEEDIDARLKRDVEYFGRCVSPFFSSFTLSFSKHSELQSILLILSGLAKHNLFGQVLRHGEINGKLAQCKETLDHCYKTFQVCPSLTRVP